MIKTEDQDEKEKRTFLSLVPEYFDGEVMVPEEGAMKIATLWFPESQAAIILLLLQGDRLLPPAPLLSPRQRLSLGQ